MLTYISFNNFKCLDGKSFNLNRINIFSGYNGRGKSSLLQSLLMLSQSVHAAKNVGSGLERLHLTGNLVYLGDYDEILTHDKNTKISLEIHTDDSQCETVHLGYELSDEDIMVGNLCSCIINGNDLFGSVGMFTEDDDSRHRNLAGSIPQSLTNQFKYVYFTSADRQGPVKFVERQEIPEFRNVGSRGDLTVNLIASYKESVDAAMNVHASDSHSYSLKESVTQWMEEIMNGGEVDINDSIKKNPVFSLGFKFGKDQEAHSFKSYNVGYGYSYILSVVVTALIARKGSIVIIENPEAHLHAKAQSKLTNLLAKLASRGVQVFIETHSEHIVNGFRLAALRDEMPITNDDMSIYFFDEDFSITHLAISPNGRIPNWPRGFFDQAMLDAAEIMRLGAKVKSV